MKTKIKPSFAFVLLVIAISFFGGRISVKREWGVESDRKEQVAGEKTADFSPSKTKKPEVKFFVMSFCPYGNQAEEGLEPVYQLLRDKVNWQPRYIINDRKISCEQSCPRRVYNQQAEEVCNDAIAQGKVKDMAACREHFPYQSIEECLQKECQGLKPGDFQSLHGEQELNQDVREICAYRLGSWDKWWKFVLLVNKKCDGNNADVCWVELAEQAGLSSQQISSCVASQREALIKKEIEEAERHRASGSPTVFVNGTLYRGGRSPNDYKGAICAAFENPPVECEKKLSSAGNNAAGGCQ